VLEGLPRSEASWSRSNSYPLKRLISGYVKGTITSVVRCHFVPNDVRRHRSISISYMSLLPCHRLRAQNLSGVRCLLDFAHTSLLKYFNRESFAGGGSSICARSKVRAGHCRFYSSRTGQTGAGRAFEPERKCKRRVRPVEALLCPADAARHLGSVLVRSKISCFDQNWTVGPEGEAVT
jgi:hypothetical protein